MREGKEAFKMGPFSSFCTAIDDYIERHRRRLNIPGVSLAVVEGDSIVHARGFGQARPGGETPSPQTPFFIGSVTKSFTALAVMQLVEAGKVELDEPVQRYLPWFRVADLEASARITVRHLLNQSGGLPLGAGWATMGNFDNSRGAAERQARGLATVALHRPPGNGFEYSNLNYDLLGLVIEAASGEPYAAYIQKYIFNPLGMIHSYSSKEAAKQDGLAVGHQSWFGFPIAVPDLPVPVASLPSGQLISSAEDMAHYLMAHLNEGRYGDEQVLSPEGMAELHRPAVDAGSFFVKEQYAMGWYVEAWGETTILSHSGLVPDFFAYVGLVPSQRRGLVLLFNVDHFTMQPTLSEICAGAALLLAGRPAPPIKLGAVPWAVRGLALVPLLQIAGVAATLGMLRRWQANPSGLPSRPRLWGQHVALPLIPNVLLAAIPVLLIRSRLLGFMRLFAPDVTFIGLTSGVFAAVWALLRTGLVLRAGRHR